MNLSQYIIISKGTRAYSYNTKLVKTLKGTMPSNAIAIKLNITVPDNIFTKPQLEATIKIDEKDISKPTIEAHVLDNIKEQFTQSLGIDMNINIVEKKEKRKVK